MKKRVVFLLMVLSVFTLYAGGGQQASQNGGPMVIEWLGFNQSGILMSQNSEVKRIMEEKYNVKINFVEVDNTNNLQNWNLYWASGEIPHFVNTNFGRDSYQLLIDQGIVRDFPAAWLDTYMPDWMRNIYASIDRDTVLKQIGFGESANGKAYVIPYTGGDSYPATMVIRKDWLDNLGITQLPGNNDELFEVLRRFTFDDPDRNGRNDTYGMNFSTNYYLGGASYVATSMGVWPETFREINGKVIFNDVTDEYREYLKLANRWIAAGVVDPESILDDRTVVRQKWAANTLGVLADSTLAFATTAVGNVMDMIKEAHRTFWG